MKKVLSIAIVACALHTGSAFGYVMDNAQFDRCVSAAHLQSANRLRIGNSYWQENNTERGTQTVKFNAKVRVNDELVPQGVACELKRNGELLTVLMQPGVYVQKKRN